MAPACTAMPDVDILAGINALQQDLCVRSVAELGVKGYTERQQDLLISLAASDCPLPICVVLELHNLCEAAPLINDVRGRGHHWTQWYREAWHPWISRSSRRRATDGPDRPSRDTRAEIACVALGSAMIAHGGLKGCADSQPFEDQLRQLLRDVHSGASHAERDPQAWKLLDEFAARRDPLHSLLGAGHAAMLLSDDPAWLPDPIFFGRALGRASEAGLTIDPNAPSRRGASGSPDLILAEFGEFRDVAVTRLPENPSRLVPTELLWMVTDFDVFLQRAFGEGLLARLGEKRAMTARRPRVCVVLDLVVDESDWKQGEDGLRPVSELRSMLHAAVCYLADVIDPKRADVEFFFGLEAPWCCASEGRVRIHQSALHLRLGDMREHLDELLVPTKHLWTDLPASAAVDVRGAGFGDPDEIVVMEFGTTKTSRRKLPEGARVHRLCLLPDGACLIDGVKLDVGVSQEDRRLCDVDSTIAARVAVCLLSGAQSMGAELQQ